MTLKVEYTILLAIIGLIYAVVKAALPDAPINPDGLLLFALYVLAKLGVEVIGKPLLRRAFPRYFRAARYTPPE